jgi:hypothetical protein
MGPAPLGGAFKGMCIRVTSNPSKKFFSITAVVLYAKFPTQTEFCRFGGASLASETPSGFFPFFGLSEVDMDFVWDSDETSAGTASAEFNFRFFCLRFSAWERTGSSGTVSVSRT